MNAPSAVADVMVVGGGPAGAAAAIELARGGRAVVLVEKTARAQDKVCGEFLSVEAVESLRALGIDPAARGAPRIESVRFAGKFGVSEVRLPFAAMSWSRRVLDEALLECAANAGVTVMRGRAVEQLERGEDGWRARTCGAEGKETIAAPHVVLATGKHDLRGFTRPAGWQNDLVAFKMRFQLAATQADALERCIELMLFSGGYAGLAKVEDGTASLGCVVRRKKLRSVGGRWDELLELMVRSNPHLRDRMHGAEALLDRPLAASAIPYGFVRREAIAETMWAVGDQAAVIPSFTGDGIAMALHSGRVAARMLLSGEDARAYQRRLYSEVRRQVMLATVYSRGLVAEPQRTVLEGVARLWPAGLRRVAISTRLAARPLEASKGNTQMAAR